MFTSLLDSCVLEEIKRVDRGHTPKLAWEKAGYLTHKMRTHFGDSLVSQCEGLEGTYGLPDPDDEHVLAISLRPDLGLPVVMAMSARSGNKHAPQSSGDILDSLDSIYRMEPATSLIRALL